jgi:FG-GAP repeat protein
MDIKELELPGLELVDPNAEYSSDQIIYIDFDGAEGILYDNDALDIHIDNLSVEHSGLSEEEQFQIISDLNNIYADTGVSFTVSVPANQEFSTIYVGGDGSFASEYGSFLGLSETIDTGNQIKNDEAFVFSDKINSTAGITETIAHEAGHLLGFKHAETTDSIYDYAELSYTPINSFEAFSMAADATNAVDSRIADAVSRHAIHIFSVQDHDNGRYVRNPAVWTGDVDLTSISPWNSDRGKNKAGTLITPQHIVFAAHYQMYAGTIIRFVTEDNEVIERTITSTTIAPEYSPYWPDYVIGELDEAVPDSITPALYMPDNMDAYLNGNDSYGIPAFVLDQEEKALIADIRTLYESATMTGYTYPDSVRYEYYEDQIGGDSGDPGFLIVDNQLVLLEVRTYGGPGSGTSQTMMKHSIQDIIDDYPAATGYALNTVDVSHFTTYEQDTNYTMISGDPGPTKDAGFTVLTGSDGPYVLYEDGIVPSGDVYEVGTAIEPSEYFVAVLFDANDCFLTINGALNYYTDSSFAYGVYFGVNSGKLTIGVDGSLKVDNTMSNGDEVFGVFSYNLLTTDGIFGDVTVISDTDRTYGIGALMLDFSGGDIFGNITVDKLQFYTGTSYKKEHTYGLFSLSELYTADIVGDIAVTGHIINAAADRYDRANSMVRGMYAQGNMVIQDVFGNISSDAIVEWDNNAYADSYGLYALGTMTIGTVFGSVRGGSYSETGEAYARGIHANGNLTIDDISGTVEAFAWAEIATNTTLANAVRGDVVSGRNGAALIVSEFGVVSAFAGGGDSSVANAFVATGGMNLDIRGTVVADGTNPNGVYRSLYAYGDASDTVVLRSTANITGDIVLNGGDDNLTIESGITISDDIDMGDGSDVLTFGVGDSGVIPIEVYGDITGDDLMVNFDVQELGINSILLMTSSVLFGDNFGLFVDAAQQGLGSYALMVNNAYSLNTFFAGETFLVNGTESLTVGGDNLILGTREFELDTPFSNQLVLTVSDYDSVAPDMPTGLTQNVDNINGSALLDWGDSSDNLSGVAGYVVEYATIDDFSDAISVTTAVSDVDISGLTDGAWYWRVKAVDVATNESAWSNDLGFVVDLPDTRAPGLPSGLTPVVNGDTVALDWTDSTDDKSGISEYVVEYSTDADFVDADSATVIASDLDLSALDAGYYHWRVKAVDAAGNESAWVTDVFTIMAAGQDKLISPEIVANSSFGQVVAISGDTVVVGAGFDDVGSASNDIYIYSWNDVDTAWDETVIYVSDDQSSWSNYLDISGTTIVVGDKRDNENGESSGCVYVYQWDGDIWAEAKLTASDAEAGDQFGWSAAIDGDTIVVGARYEDDNGDDSGSAYIYQWNGSGWDETKLLSSDGANRDAFGASVAVSGDTVVVGARYDDDNGPKSGTAYIYQLNGSIWEETKLVSSDVTEDDRFGGAVTVDGDIVVVGASGDDDNGTDSGSAYIYRKNGETWEETKITASDGAAGDLFGWSVAVVDGDTDTVIIGAYGFDGYGLDSGSAYMYQWNGDIWVESKFVAVDVMAGDNFGWSLAIDGDRVVTGARREDSNGTDAGSAYTFELASIVDLTPPTVPTELTDVVYGNDVTLDWGDSIDIDGGSGISEYIIEYANNTNFGDANVEITSSSELDISGLNNDDYYWRVKAVDVATNASDWSDIDSFTVDVQVLDAPSGLSLVINGDSVALDWADSVGLNYGVKEYVVEYSTSGSFVDAESQASVASELDLNALADGIWSWRVKVEDNNATESAWSVGNSFLIDVTAPSIPVGLSEVVNDDTVIFDWETSVDGGIGVHEYVLEYSEYSDFTDAVTQTSVADELNIAGLSDGFYYWRVKVEDANGNESLWSEVDDFLVDTTNPSVPIWLHDIVDGGSVTLSWYDSADSAGGSGIDGYVVEYADNAGFTDATEQIVYGTALALSQLSFNTYYWRVQAVDRSGNSSDWSAVDSFITGDTVGNSFQRATLIDVDDTYTNSEYVGIGDAYDYYTFDLTNSGEFDFALTDLDAKAIITLYELDNSKGFPAYKKIRSAGSSLNKFTEERIAALENILLDAGTYYVEVTSGDKGAGKYNTDYTLVIEADYFPVQSPDEFNFRTGIGTPASLILDDDADASASGWVGFGDAQDVYEFDVTTIGEFDFALTNLDSKAVLFLYQLDGAKFKKIKKASAKYNKWNGETSASFDDILLDTGTYYLEVLSGDNGKGKYNTEYDLDVIGDSFPAATDNNTWDDATAIVPDTSLAGFVGFGDASDYYQFEVLNLSAYDFELSGDDKDAKLTVYQWDEVKDKLKKLSSASLKYGEARIENLNLNAGLYYVEVLSSDKGKGKYNTEYDLDITLA